MIGLTHSELDQLSSIITGEHVESWARPEAVTEFIRLAVELEIEPPIMSLTFTDAKAKVEAKMLELAQEWFEEAGVYDDAPERFAPFIADEVTARRDRHEDPRGENDRADYMRDLMGDR